MTLAAIEQAMADMLWLKDGYTALSSPSAYQAYLENTSPEKKEALEHIPYEKLIFYRDRLHSGMSDILSMIYPHCKTLLGSVWAATVEIYRRFYPNRSYLVFGGAGSFIEFLGTQEQIMATMPYIQDLAQYEWLEFEVLNHPDEFLPEDYVQGIPENITQCDTYMPKWNSARAICAMNYDIPLLIQQLKSTEPFTATVALQSTIMLLYRDPADFQARFFRLNESSLALLSYESHLKTYTDIIDTLPNKIADMKTSDMSSIRSQALAFYRDCLAKNILLGSVKVG